MRTRAENTLKESAVEVVAYFSRRLNWKVLNFTKMLEKLKVVHWPGMA